MKMEKGKIKNIRKNIRKNKSGTSSLSGSTLAC